MEEEKVEEEVELKVGKKVEVEVCGERNYGRASRSAAHLPQTILPKANTMRATARVRPRSQIMTSSIRGQKLRLDRHTVTTRPTS